MLRLAAKRLGIPKSAMPSALTGKVSLFKRRDPSPMDWIRQVDGSHFVQVGAHYRTNDPLRKFAMKRGWHGFMIEADPENYARLDQNYRSHWQFKAINAAISHEIGTVPFYRVSEADRRKIGLPDWFSEIGSLDKAHIIKHVQYLGPNPPDVEPHISSVDIPCAPLDVILRLHWPRIVDVLQIDTEGYDYQVLRHFDFASLRPQVVMFEHRHLSQDDRDAADNLLVMHGYSLKKYEFDTLGWRH